jgi:hypothetical protein
MARARPGRRARRPDPVHRQTAMSRYGGGVEPEPPRERDNPRQRHVESDWSPYDEAAEAEDAEWRRGRRRRMLAISGVVLLVLCLIGSIAGYLWYDRATKIDRSTPVVVVEQYVYTIFADRDLAGAEIFECDGASRDGILGLLADIEERERKFDIAISVSTANYSSSTVGDTAEVKVSLRIDVPEEDGKPSRSTQQWQFQLRDDDGWRVCSGQRAS